MTRRLSSAQEKTGTRTSGRGTIGLKAFRRMVRNRVLRKAAWLLEVPGYEGNGPGKADVDMLKALRDESELPDLPTGAD